MIKVLWIMNKYVHGRREQSYYPQFLQSCQEEMNKRGYLLMFAFFSNELKESIGTCRDCHYYDESTESPKVNISKEAHRIEREYNITFKQSYLADIIQVSKYQNYRKINLPEKDFIDLDKLVLHFLYLEKLISDTAIDVCFCDDSPEYQMEFGRAICLSEHKIFLRYTSSFLGRCNFAQHLKWEERSLRLLMMSALP